MTTHIVIIEEASHTRPELFYTIIVPLLGTGNTVLLGIATPSDDGQDFYSSLWDVRDKRGKPIFRTIDIELACHECKASGEASKCQHKKGLLPSWKSQERVELVSAIMATWSEEAEQRENRGLMAGGPKYVFRQEWIRALVERPRYELPLNVPIVYTGVDPNGGGEGSDFAICSMAHFDGHEVVGVISMPSLHMYSAMSSGA